MVSAPSMMKTRRLATGLKYAARCTARNWPTCRMGRTTGFRSRTGSGTMPQTSGCVWSKSGTRSTVAESGLSPRSAEPLFDERGRVLKLRDGPARTAFAAKIVLQPLAVGRLREHSRQREFPHAARPREEHGVGHPLAPQHPPQRGHDSLVSYKFREPHTPRTLSLSFSGTALLAGLHSARPRLCLHSARDSTRESTASITARWISSGERCLPDRASKQSIVTQLGAVASSS